MHGRFVEDYVIAMIDTYRMTGGAELGAELTEGKRSGIPWMAILDARGEQLITSDGPKGNCCFPTEPHEIDHFMAMLDKTRRHMTDDDRNIIERELKDYGAELARPRREPGRTDYDAAIQSVKFGRFGTAVSKLGDAFEKGLPPAEMLTEPRLRSLREDPDRRAELFELLKQHVRANHIRLVDAREAGRRIRLAGRVIDMKSGEALAGALVQLYHTDATGEYRPGMDAGGGAGNPRIRGYLRTDGEGRFTVDTIMPERYPRSAVPRHVHYHVRAEGYPELVSECFFDSDPNLDAETRKNAPGNNFPIVELKPDADLRLVGALTIRVRR